MSSTTTDSKVFNIADISSGPEASASHTTVAHAEINAPNPQAAREIEHNANKEQQVAQQAASVAKTLGPEFTGEPSTAADEFHDSAARRTDAAVAEGKHDVAEAKAVGGGYVEQAKAFAATALETAQAYLPESAGGKALYTTLATTARGTQPNTAEGITASGIVASAGAAAGTVYNTAGNVYSQVAAAAQPHIDHAIEVAQPHTDHVIEVAQPHIEHAKVVAAGYIGDTRSQGTISEKSDKP